MLNTENFAEIIPCAVGVGLTLLGLLVGIGLVRAAAMLAFVLVAIIAAGFAAFNILSGEWVGWFNIAWHSLATGGAAAILSLPLLPFTPFFNKGK